MVIHRIRRAEVERGVIIGGDFNMDIRRDGMELGDELENISWRIFTVADGTYFRSGMEMKSTIDFLIISPHILCENNFSGYIQGRKRTESDHVTL